MRRNELRRVHETHTRSRHDEVLDYHNNVGSSRLDPPANYSNPNSNQPPPPKRSRTSRPHRQPVQERTQPTPVMLYEVAVSFHDLEQVLIVLVRHVDLLSPPIDSMLQVSCQALVSQRTAHDTAKDRPSTAATHALQRVYRSELKIRLIGS